MDISIIIVNYNSVSFLEKCLESLNLFLMGVKHEICVVDNASIDGSVQMVRKQFPQVQLIPNLSNLGFAAGVNIGLRKTSGRYVLWLNPDATLLTDSFKNLIQYMDEHPNIGIIGSQIVNSDGSIQFSCRSFPSYKTALFNRYSFLTRWFSSNSFSQEYLLTGWDHASVREVDWVSGASLLHRRELIEKIGFLDEKFFMYCEDVDFCLRAKRYGWKVYYYPEVKVLHHIGGSSRTISQRMIIERHKSMWYYYTKHFHRNVFKDVVVLFAIVGRCLFQIVKSLLKLPIKKIQLQKNVNVLEQMRS